MGFDIPPPSWAFIGAIFGAGVTSLVNYHLMKRNQTLAMRQTAVQELARIEGLFVQFPELYKYFHDKKSIGENDEITRIKATAISHNYMKIFAILILHQMENRKMFGDWVDNTIKNRYSTSPILRDTFIEHIEEYKISGKNQLKLMLKGMLEQENSQLNKIEIIENTIEKKEVLSFNSRSLISNLVDLIYSKNSEEKLIAEIRELIENAKGRKSSLKNNDSKVSD